MYIRRIRKKAKKKKLKYFVAGRSDLLLFKRSSEKRFLFPAEKKVATHLIW